jgi:hypothetical protein
LVGGSISAGANWVGRVAALINWMEIFLVAGRDLHVDTIERTGLIVFFA